MLKLSKVRLLTSRVGHDIQQAPGDIVEMSPDEAERHVSAGLAEYANQATIPQHPIDGIVENATAAHPGIETAIQDRKGKPNRKS